MAVKPIYWKWFRIFYEHYLTLSEKNELSQNLKLTHFYYPQSQYLLLLAENGILGFIIWFLIIILCFHKIMLKFNIFKSHIGVLFLLCFSSSLIDLDIQNFRFFYLLIGFGLMFTHKNFALDKKVNINFFDILILNLKVLKL